MNYTQGKDDMESTGLIVLKECQMEAFSLRSAENVKNHVNLFQKIPVSEALILV